MATINLRSNQVVHALGFLCLMIMAHRGAAGSQFTVGGQKGWSVPSDPNFNPYNQWAEKSRFQIGDSLLFNYQSGQDSVLHVKSEDYASCNTGSPYAKYSDGHTVFTLNQSGSFFFISGNKDNCVKNEKLVVIVLADRSNRNSSKTNQTPSPSPSPSPPSPESLSPSPSPPTGETNPTPAPVSEPPPPNAAASIFVSSAASVGTFMASLLMLSL